MALAAQAAPSKVVPPSSFAKLLRRSKFASYDPAIRQTYQAPPANAHRGDWGLKRPIALRRRNAFISLTSFEHHAHFAEWNHAENQVRFIRRIEEMGAKVVVSKSRPWYKSLGMARSAPPLDSDFCAGESAEVVLETKPGEDSDKGSEVVNLNSLGKRGPGAYGSQREEPSRVEDQHEIFVTRNIQAMSSREFKRYLRSLRAQRSVFQDFVNAEERIPNKNLHALAMQEDNVIYRQFLMSQMQKEYADYHGKRIQPQPHPNGAALYSKPTALESLLWTPEKPGFYLNDIVDAAKTKTAFSKAKNSVVSFGGITACVDGSVVVGKKMLLDKTTEQGVKLGDIEESVLQLRLDPAQGITISRLPRTVGRKPEGLKGVRVGLELIKGDSMQMGWSNPHPLGSPEYVAMFTNTKKPLSSFSNPPSTTVSWDDERKPNTHELFDTLRQTMRPNKKL